MSYYSFSRKLQVETAYLNNDGMSAEFENTQVSPFLAKLLQRTNATYSKRARNHAFEALLIQQVIYLFAFDRNKLNTEDLESDNIFS